MACAPRRSTPTNELSHVSLEAMSKTFEALASRWYGACYSPLPNHEHEDRHPGSPCRQCLQEWAGNIQLPHMAWYGQQFEVLSSIPPSIPPVMAAPVLRTQSLGPDYGTPAYPGNRTQQRQEARLRGRKQGRGSNPLMPLLTQAFQNYRKKQADKSEQKWPEALEGHFLDALLLIPQMGRSKYSIEQRQQGRNQLIGKYLWLASCRDLGPGEKPSALLLEIRGEKGRKRVSSHIQVVRNFFAAHRCLHFLFGPRQKDKDDKDDRHIEKVSLKNNPILIALSENRMPDQRPNYEYFAQILALNEQVQFRPRRCWIFVSHPDVLVSKDGSGYLPTTGTKLGQAEYPHLRRNLERETWAKEEKEHLFRGALLHEFTKEIHQVESGSVGDLARKWASAFPSLQQRLRAITSSTTDGQCDVLHLHTTLELKEKPGFPADSSLGSWVEIGIEQPHLLNHRWRVETHLVGPPELSYAHDGSGEVSYQEDIYERHGEFTIRYQHQPGCDGWRSSSSSSSSSSSDSARGHCDCLSQRSGRDAFSVPFPIPFPATAWAQTLANCAEHPAHPFSGSKRHTRGWGVECEREDREEAGWRRRGSKESTQMDLVPKIAMMQEILSCPPPAPSHQGESSEASSEQGWTRRGLILWTFDTIHSVAKEGGRERGKLQTASGGRTCWRFLTLLDPSSEHHLRQAAVTSRRTPADEFRGVSDSLACASRPGSRAAIPSPTPSHPQHPSATTDENFPPAWDSVAVGPGALFLPPTTQAYGADVDAVSHAIPPHAAAGETGYELPDSFGGSHGGLATPPSTASAAGSLAQPFRTASAGSDVLPGYASPPHGHGPVTTADLGAGPHTLGGALPGAMTDPFLSDVGGAYGGAQDGIIHGWDSHVHVAVAVAGLDPRSSPGYSDASAAAHQVHHHDTIAWSAGTQPQTVRPRRGSEQQQHHHHHHSGSTEQHTWASSTHSDSIIDNHELWMPPIAAETPAAETAPPPPPAGGGPERGGGNGDDDDAASLGMPPPVSRKRAREDDDPASDEEGYRRFRARY
ncbi:uncharacterized protein P884DRAFT_315607 [Thermothelomyces heterothallicus CBS 202.75]|uniref:uncharacterized protein n=1 Tax=Thermothelomyces heterothallicus CBS 202.75 TaxID=1149848 RepID=UPI00374383A7